MSWQLASFGLLALTLVAGGIAYERSRPPSQLVALVAALAALAIAGRVALAPVPNVVPVTDVALLTGFALGGIPGFAVGSLAALVSNFWLGQGPWTPWQMAAWGGCGLAGAALAATGGRRLGRYGLATACALAGLGYGAILDLSLMVSYGGEQSLERYLAISASGIPFNLAHAAGNFALALVAGPAIVRALTRYRRRFEFAWGRGGRRAGGAVAGVLLALAVLAAAADRGPRPALARAEPAPAGAVAAAAGGPSGAVRWLRRIKNADGGFGLEPEAESDPAMTGWAVLGLEAAGLNPLDLGRRGRTPIRYLRGTAGEIRTTGDIERTVMLLSAAGLRPRRFGGADLVARLRRRRRPNGSIAGQVNLTAFCVLALEAARSPGGNRGSANWLARSQNDDGGWGFHRGAASDPDSTGAALQALAAAGRHRPALRAGVRYLRRVQESGGGYSLLGGGPNSQSTAWAVQGLLAAGTRPLRVRRDGRSPLHYLARRQQANGHYRYSKASNQTPVWVTAQALAAVSLKPFPLERVARRPAGAGSKRGKKAATGTRTAGSGGGGGGDGGGASPGSSGGAGLGAGGAAGAPAGDGSPARPGSGGDAPVASDGGSGAEPDAGSGAGRDGTATAVDPATAAEAEMGDGDGGVTLPIVVGAAAALALAAVWAGWLLFRRRLP